MTIITVLALVTLLYFGSAVPAQIGRFYLTGARSGFTPKKACILVVASTLSLVWHCVPAAVIFLVGYAVFA
jgi:hypothetical protein